jgi:hypothetical protein
MSRYLRADPGISYKNKKVYSSVGTTTFTFPGTSPVAKVMVFGGGGNACAGYIYDPGCCCFCCGCLCYSCIMHLSGAGGGFSEKLYTGVPGTTACVVVGDVAGTSSFCISGLGTVSATGGTSASISSGPGTNPRCTAFGVGSGGDINKCGSLGACRITSFNCNCCYGGCLYSTGLVAIPGGAPGNSVTNGCAPSVTTNNTVCCIHCCRYTNPSPYGTNYCNCFDYRLCVFCDLPRGFGSCPVETDKFYSYDWDVVGGSKVETSGNPTSTSVTSTTILNCSFSCSSMNGCSFGVTIAIPSTYPTGTNGGITGSGGAGGVGGIGGGGGGVYTSCATVRCIGSINCTCGGTGLVIVYY